MKLNSIPINYDKYSKRELKDIDLTTNIRLSEEDLSEEAENIKELIDGQNAAIVHFADNGNLPGKVTVRIKADYSDIKTTANIYGHLDMEAKKNMANNLSKMIG